MSTTRRTTVVALAVAAGLTALVACGSGGGGKSTDPKTVTLVSHDSFNASKSVLEEFTKQTGYKVNVLKGGDAGKAVNQAILSKDNPQGDVFFGIDNTLLSRGLKAGIFSPYQAKGLERVPEELQLDKAEHRVTPVDYGDTCVNYDRAYFAEHKIAPPRTFDDLLKPEYKGLLVTENSATSSPGLAFQLGTIAKYGESGWQDYWKKLKANGVEVVDGWEQAYNERFSGSAAGKGKGDKPLVVSYASSPPVEVLGKKPEPKEAPTGVATGTCFRQTEFAGLLKGAGNEKGGKALLDFLLSKKFQEDVPLQMFVNPARTDAKVPELFTKYGEKIDKPGTVAPEAITENREKWIKQWSSLVLK
ncbi:MULTISPECIES: thiamine ABC transporter substrate-binding protein [Streptomyces]|uniref:Thiamine ABC transporter substrate-binding protein n=2 Tax=Streptomyces rimosus subsp. rimosus TaxID=132474 RepID=L8EY96_STRR1|nr:MULTISPECIES: thiamine ABC transporter substrate-binding protein [Streptomyces]KOG73945.1 ABC transporter substrate-binding protein [Kitasatospora aureofaciens]MYT48043.1 thiamine ABC transporter substrate-binding protein [Streptomyces sp. SID5471]KEF04259.1 ABC transporter substrate-binding protein [Streptomyces rimosus]KUJ40730.1 ABC transporter substrate-binding protein [Streptomyces rimosus subsp. rimosus]QDA04182.1 thiamine ABC transporter substrate-binding protein [Streptomyces rimosu